MNTVELKFRGVELVCEYKTIDESFDHEFGTKIQIRYEVQNVYAGGVNIAGILDEATLEAIDVLIEEKVGSWKQSSSKKEN